MFFFSQNQPTWSHIKLEIDSDLTFMKSEIKICKADFLQTKKMWTQNELKICLTEFFQILALNTIHPYQSTENA